MAHSNRKKLRDARGGLTRNQQRKVRQASTSGASTRLAETIKWMEQNAEKKRLVATPNVKEVKVIKYAKNKRAVIRRQRALGRLEQRLLNGVEDANVVVRIKNEIQTLKNKI